MTDQQHVSAGTVDFALQSAGPVGPDVSHGILPLVVAPTLPKDGHTPQPAAADHDHGEAPDRVRIWGLPLARWTLEQTIDAVQRLIERGQPAWFITANLHYAMLTQRNPRLRAANERAAFLVADGMPLVWYSRLTGRPLPQRVTGADLVYPLCQRAAQRGYRVFLLGGAAGVAEAASAELTRRCPGFRIVGTAAPVLERLSAQEHADLVAQIRRVRPDLLLVAFGQPKGELWLAEHCEALGVPACVQLGATFDFVAGRASRAPRWLQRLGLEWLYRLVCEPRRLGPRYLANGWFMVRAVVGDLARRIMRRGSVR